MKKAKARGGDPQRVLNQRSATLQRWRTKQHTIPKMSQVWTCLLKGL